MRPAVAIGGSREFKPWRAIMVYRDGHTSEVFATTHEILRARGAARLGAGSLVTASFLQELAEGLGASLKPEVLPPNVLCRTPHMIAWWTASHYRPLFFRRKSELGKVSGRHFPIPPLVWKVVGRELWVRALPDDARPGPDTELLRAPFWNTNGAGLVCQGSMKKPVSVTSASLREWEDGYFSAEFSHVFDAFGAADATSHPDGMKGLWGSLAGARTRPRPFPMEHLVTAKETLQKFVERGGSRA